MLGVHGQHLHTAAGGQVRDQRARTDKAFFVGQSESRTILESRQARLQTGEPNNGVEHEIGLDLTDKPGGCVRAATHTDLRIERRRYGGRGPLRSYGHLADP